MAGFAAVAFVGGNLLGRSGSAGPIVEQAIITGPAASVTPTIPAWDPAVPGAPAISRTPAPKPSAPAVEKTPPSPDTPAEFREAPEGAFRLIGRDVLGSYLVLDDHEDEDFPLTPDQTRALAAFQARILLDTAGRADVVGEITRLGVNLSPILFLATAHQTMGRHDEALAIIRGLIDVLPDQPIGWFALARSALEAGRRDEAL